MRIDIITVHPELLSSYLNHSILKRAQDKKLVQLSVINLREYSTDKHKNVDDYAYGGGAGMVMQAEPIANCIDSLKKTVTYDDIIYMCPDGELLEQPMLNSFSLKKNLLILCGHYKGIDQRIRDTYITREISIGDYVLSGGEIPAAALSDGIIRLLPGVLNDETSALFDSFQDNLLAPPVYTRPENWRGITVPEVLLSGNEKAINEWRHEKSIEVTKQKRPNLLNNK